MADKGYDSNANHRAVVERGAMPVIAIRKLADKGIYTKDGTPTCMGQIAMKYVRSDPERGHLYRCPDGGCALKDRKGVRYCHDWIWEKPDPNGNLRLVGPVRRASTEWKALYKLRQGVERVFKSMKESRRLNSHSTRGLRMVALHASMSALTFQATALANVLSEQPPTFRWMVRRVA